MAWQLAGWGDGRSCGHSLNSRNIPVFCPLRNTRLVLLLYLSHSHFGEAISVHTWICLLTNFTQSVSKSGCSSVEGIFSCFNILDSICNELSQVRLLGWDCLLFLLHCVDPSSLNKKLASMNTMSAFQLQMFKTGIWIIQGFRSKTLECPGNPKSPSLPVSALIDAYCYRFCLPPTTLPTSTFFHWSRWGSCSLTPWTFRTFQNVSYR